MVFAVSPLLNEKARPRADHTLDQLGKQLVIVLGGSWTADHALTIEPELARWPGFRHEATRAVLDMSAVTKLDTMGAYVLSRFQFEAGSDGMRVEITGAKPEHLILLKEVSSLRTEPVLIPSRSGVITCLADIGHTVIQSGRDLIGGVSFLGEIMTAMGRAIVHPTKFRGPSLINQLEFIAFRGAPIIMLISFLVGCIVAQQSIFQLQRFGASVFVVNLTGILILRELAVLLTSIMVAGRSGSAFTAEIGSMKMREEIDALRVMGLDPIEVLVVPRILALLLALPILTFVSMMSGLVGAGLVSWAYGGIGLDTYIARLQTVVTYKHFTVGLIKAPFMALVIGIIASLEGLAVKGSAESLGQQVTASVVKAIFMVIVVDGLFAMFFAAIQF
jgi:phospholipid/cholesterol/gamma-HCH transport system permease protein